MVKNKVEPGMACHYSSGTQQSLMNPELESSVSYIMRSLVNKSK